jgi:DNA repair protein RadC
MTIGTTTQTLVSPRDLFQEIIRQGATRAIVAHNHPSGKTDPSLEDLDLTRSLLQGGIFLQLPIVDHLILGCGNWCSLRQTTQLWNDYPQGD